jgi:SAM-dependent methyltransferase
MGSVEENREAWNSRDWTERGDDWSAAWGSPAAEWYGTLLPRIHPWLPAGTVLEIGPGFGRWTRYLKDLAQHLVLVDVAATCIEGCRARFASVPNITYHVNDGRSLAMLEEGTIDLAFSFDSLVHAEADVIDAYLDGLARALAPDGVGFLHHSNLGACAGTGVSMPNPHWRAASVTAHAFARSCANRGLQCRSQELITWWCGDRLTDCISVFTRHGSRWARDNMVVTNPRFMAEAEYVAGLDRLYGLS